MRKVLEFWNSDGDCVYTIIQCTCTEYTYNFSCVQWLCVVTRTLQVISYPMWGGRVSACGIHQRISVGHRLQSPLGAEAQRGSRPTAGATDATHWHQRRLWRWFDCCEWRSRTQGRTSARFANALWDCGFKNRWGRKFQLTQISERLDYGCSKF